MAVKERFGSFSGTDWANPDPRDWRCFAAVMDALAERGAGTGADALRCVRHAAMPSAGACARLARDVVAAARGFVPGPAMSGALRYCGIKTFEDGEYRHEEDRPLAPDGGPRACPLPRGSGEQIDGAARGGARGGATAALRWLHDAVCLLRHKPLEAVYHALRTVSLPADQGGWLDSPAEAWAHVADPGYGGRDERAYRREANSYILECGATLARRLAFERDWDSPADPAWPNAYRWRARYRVSAYYAIGAEAFPLHGRGGVVHGRAVNPGRDMFHSFGTGLEEGAAVELGAVAPGGSLDFAAALPPGVARPPLEAMEALLPAIPAVDYSDPPAAGATVDASVTAGYGVRYFTIDHGDGRAPGCYRFRQEEPGGTIR